MNSIERKVSVIGLGYVGLPVAIAFGLRGKVIGFDINEKRIDELKKGFDRTREVTEEELNKADITFTSSLDELAHADFHIVAVPTPVDSSKRPNLTPMIKASETVGKVLKKGDIVVFESTVYPGACEEDCIPVLEKFSNLKAGVDFKIGYSPERINPGDKEHTFTKITKIVSAQDEQSLEIVANVYSSVVEAGVYRASSIKVAEAAKVIENTQRDVNIALVNELAYIFDRMGIDTNEVIDAAGTKWNFLKFRPGLVGGHCIGVDPYYLTHKAEQLGYHPHVILSGRKINDGVGKFVAERCIKEMIHAGKVVKGSPVTIMGLTFKENCPDLRNSKVVDIFNELNEYKIDIQLCDPMVEEDEVEEIYGKNITEMSNLKSSDAIIFAVAHTQFKELNIEGLKKILNPGGVVVDVKGIFNPKDFINSGFKYWRL